MKFGSFWSWSLGAGLLALPLIGGSLSTVSSPPQLLAATETTVIETDPNIPLVPPPDATGTNPPASGNAEDAKVQPLPAEFVLPPNVQPGKSLADLIRLAQSGAGEGALLAFVTNSPSRFTPGADDLIYLKDIGVPENVVTAMLQRDEQLKAGAAASVTAPEPAAPATAPAAPAPYAAAPAAVAASAAPAEPAPAPPPDYAPESVAPPPVEVSDSDFYQALAPYGSWVQVDGYGNCWQPAIACSSPSWQPYFDGGCWVYTDCGWYWRSDYTWGWAPFHYGRWFRHQRWGWCWRPDRVWGPSWVCWRHSQTHCGWAPLPPGVRFTAGVGLTGSLRPVTHLSAQHFRFVEWSHFRDHNLRQHALSHDQSSRIYGQTTLATHIVVSHGRVRNDGVSPERVAAATHVPITRVDLHDVPRTPATHSHRVGALYFRGPNAARANHQPEEAPNRSRAPGTASFGSLHTTPPTSERTRHNQAEPPRPWFQRTREETPRPGPGAAEHSQTPGTASSGGLHNTPPMSERFRHSQPENPRPWFQRGREDQRPSPGATGHFRHEAAPAERPARVEAPEPHFSRVAPARQVSSPPPARASSWSNRPDRSDRSDSGSHHRR